MSVQELIPSARLFVEQVVHFDYYRLQMLHLAFTNGQKEQREERKSCSYKIKREYNRAAVPISVFAQGELR